MANENPPTPHRSPGPSLAVNAELSAFSLFSTTLLSTIRLNKLLHLILSALTNRQVNLFSRAMLFLNNEKTDTLQGMLGVTRTEAEALRVVDINPDNPLTGYWELDDADMERQRNSDFSKAVREIRIDLHEGCQIVAQVVRERSICFTDDPSCLKCKNCGFIQRFGITSFAAAPLATRNRMIGIIIVDNPAPESPIQTSDTHMLQLFAHQAGMAIENSQLYKDLEETHAELRETRQRLVHAAHLAAIGEMAASISHELKTPLITIGGFAYRLGKLIEGEGPERHYLNTIIGEAQRLEKLLGDILTYSRKPTICYHLCDLRDIIRQTVDDHASRLSDLNIKLRASLPDGEWPVLGDASQLKQVFINLIINAQDVMHEDGGELTITLEKKETATGKVAVAVVKDTGGGIPMDVMARIFTPFYTTKRHGTGLGLAIVSRIVQNHCGKLEAGNSDNGAVFTVTIPLSDEQQPNLDCQA